MHSAISALRSLGFTLTLAAPLASPAQNVSQPPSPPVPSQLQIPAEATDPQPVTPRQAQLDLPDAPSSSAAYLASVDAAASRSSSSAPVQNDSTPSGSVVQPYASIGPGVATEPGMASFTEPLRTHPAKRYDKYIDFTEIAMPLTARDKFVLSLRATATPWMFTSVATVAGFEQLRNSSPHYGSDSEAFAKRFGAAAARDSSQLILGDGLLAPVFHEDPRYYQLGEQHRVWTRTAYAISRVFVTRDDQGHPTPHLSLLLGNAAALALSNTYYPERDRSVSQTFANYGGSLGGAAFSFIVREFLDQALYDLHISNP
jgi:hypothetical protein